MLDDEKKKLHENLKQEIRSLLISSPKTKYGGLTGSLLYFDYKQLNCGKEIPYAELGFRSFLSLLRSMPDVVRIECKENSTSYRVHPIYDQSTAHIQKMVYEQNDKYEYQNRLYYQNWCSDNQLSYSQNYFSSHAHNNNQTNSRIYSKTSHQKLNNSFKRSRSQDLFLLNKKKEETKFESYLLLTPLTSIEDEKLSNNNDNINVISSYLPSKSINNNETCSTPNTFIETPPNFDLDDYQLNDQNTIEEEYINCDNNNQIDSLLEEEIRNDELLLTSLDINPNELNILDKNQLLISPSISNDNNSIISSKDNKNICETIIDEKSSSNNELNFEICKSNKEELFEINENKILIKRLNNAIINCIKFRYIHRLCEIKFKYRHYPLSNEILFKKSQLENEAFIQYEKQLKEFQQIFQIKNSIDDEIYQLIFDEYIYLQRNYYYMIKLINKNKR